MGLTIHHQLAAVLYDIAEIGFGRLDLAEGFGPGRPLAANSYVREQRHVHPDGDEAPPILVWPYLGNRRQNPPPPNAAYKKLLVDGARHWHLPEAYQAELARVESADNHFLLMSQ